MKESKASVPWPGADDRLVVEEMLRDPNSEQWNECHEFVKHFVYAQTKNLPGDLLDEIVQEAMMRVLKRLPAFQFHCSLRTWLVSTIRTCTIDIYQYRRKERYVAPSSDPHDHAEREEDPSPVASETIEDELLERDELYKALAAIQEYISTHANSARNAQILDMVLLEGRPLEEAARAAGVSAPVAGYVVRSAQRHVRQRLGYQSASETPPDSDLSSTYREQGRTYEQLAEQALEKLKRSAQDCYTTAKELGVE